MRTASLITIHVGFNFGSVLQTIATVRILESLGLNVSVIDYRPDRVTTKRYFSDALKSPLKFLWRMIYSPVYFNNRRIYSGYLKKHVKLTNPIYPKDDFVKVCPKSDYYISGSDQIWNSIHNEGFDGHYYFEGLPKDVTKIAFSSSIGRTKISSEELEHMRLLLQSYSSISVRENSAKELLSEIGIDSVQLLDPTFMLSKEQWGKYMSKRIVDDSYLLLYLPYNIADADVLYQSAHNIANAKGLKLVTFSWSIKSNKRVDKTVKFSTPGDFLSLFNYADYVITNSFHGTAFSINLNKQFSAFMPSAFSTRITSILKLTGLEDRLSNKVIDANLLKLIDYNPVNQILYSERSRAHEFLKQALK